MSKKNEFYLPPGVVPKEEHGLTKEDQPTRSVRYPTGKFYDDFTKICKKISVSKNEVIVGFVSLFIEENKFLLEDGRKK